MKPKEAQCGPWKRGNSYTNLHKVYNKHCGTDEVNIQCQLEANLTPAFCGVSLFSGMEQWNGMVEGTVEWNGME